MKKIIKDWWQRLRTFERQSHTNDINASFQVTEKGGRLWITHMGDAVESFGGDDKVDAVLFHLNQMRFNAVRYYQTNKE